MLRPVAIRPPLLLLLLLLFLKCCCSSRSAFTVSDPVSEERVKQRWNTSQRLLTTICVLFTTGWSQAKLIHWTHLDFPAFRYTSLFTLWRALSSSKRMNYDCILLKIRVPIKVSPMANRNCRCIGNEIAKRRTLLTYLNDSGPYSPQDE